MQINKDSSVDVTEIIDVNFNENRHGIYRDIQSSGIKIKILDVTDSGHNSYDYEEQIFGEGTRLKIGDPDTYVIGKKVYNDILSNRIKFLE